MGELMKIGVKPGWTLVPLVFSSVPPWTSLCPSAIELLDISTIVSVLDLNAERGTKVKKPQ
jgi:hypothetical protein